MRSQTATHGHGCLLSIALPSKLNTWVVGAKAAGQVRAVGSLNVIECDLQ